MSRELENYGINILQLHVEWLLANGYKREATSCKKQIRMILINKKKKKQKATSFKLDSTVGDDRIYLERNNTYE